MAFLSPISEERKLELATALPTETESLIDLYKLYYDGFQDVELTARQKEYILEQRGMPDSFGNICKLVVSVLSDRLKILSGGEGIHPLEDGSVKYADRASEWWQKTGLDAFQSDIHRNTIRDIETGVMIEWDQISNMPVFNPIEVWTGNKFESSVRFFTDGNDNIIFAAKQWIYVDFSDDDETTTRVRLNLYEPGQTVLEEDGSVTEQGSTVTRYIYSGNTGGKGVDARLLTTDEVFEETSGQVIDNPQFLPLPGIPIIRFENFPAFSDIDEVIRMQDMSNHFLSTIDQAVDYHGYPMLTATHFQNDDNETVGPGSMIVGENVKRIDPPDLINMWKGSIIEQLRMLAIMKRWPIWVLLTDNSGNAPSGEALRRQERPLVSQIIEKQQYFNIYWRDVFNYARDLHNYYNPADALEGDLVFQWSDPSTTNLPDTQATKVQTAKEAGISLFTILERIFGWTNAQIMAEYDRINTEREMGLLDFPEPDNPDSASIQEEGATVQEPVGTDV